MDVTINDNKPKGHIADACHEIHGILPSKEFTLLALQALAVYIPGSKCNPFSMAIGSVSIILNKNISVALRIFFVLSFLAASTVTPIVGIPAAQVLFSLITAYGQYKKNPTMFNAVLGAGSLIGILALASRLLGNSQSIQPSCQEPIVPIDSGNSSFLAPKPSDPAKEADAMADEYADALPTPVVLTSQENTVFEEAFVPPASINPDTREAALVHEYTTQPLEPVVLTPKENDNFKEAYAAAAKAAFKARQLKFYDEKSAALIEAIKNAESKDKEALEKSLADLNRWMFQAKL